MGMKTILFILTITLVSCSDMMDEKHYYVEPTLKPFVDQFYKEAKIRGVGVQNSDVEVMLGSLGSNSIGDVLGRSYSHKIVIDSDFVKRSLGNYYNTKSDSLAVEYVIFHELGHYLLSRDHISKSTFTIMTADDSYLGNYQLDYNNDRKKLVDELFKN